MKISSASKKVLASALSAAMVVAFAPTVAFGQVLEGDQVNVKFDTTGLTLASGSSAFGDMKYAVDGNNKITLPSNFMTNHDYKSGTTSVQWYYDADESGEMDGTENYVGYNGDYSIAIDPKTDLVDGTIVLKPYVASAFTVSGIPTTGFGAPYEGYTGLWFSPAVSTAGIYSATLVKNGTTIASLPTANLADGQALGSFTIVDELNETYKSTAGYIAKASMGAGTYTLTVTKSTGETVVKTLEIYKMSLPGIFTGLDGNEQVGQTVYAYKGQTIEQALMNLGGPSVFQKDAAAVKYVTEGSSTVAKNVTAYTLNGEKVATVSSIATAPALTATFTGIGNVKVKDGMVLGAIFEDEVDPTLDLANGKDITLKLGNVATGTNYKAVVAVNGAEYPTTKSGATWATAQTVFSFGTAGAVGGSFNVVVYKLTDTTSGIIEAKVAEKAIDLAAVTLDAGDGKLAAGQKAELGVFKAGTSYLGAGNVLNGVANPTPNDKTAKFLGWSLDGVNVLKTADKVAAGTAAVTLKAVYSSVKAAAPTYEWANDTLTLANAAGDGYKVQYKVGAGEYADYSGPIQLKKGADVTITARTVKVTANTAGLQNSAEVVITNSTNAAANLNTGIAALGLSATVVTSDSTANAPKYYMTTLKSQIDAAKAVITDKAFASADDWTALVKKQTAAVLQLVADYETAQIDTLVAGVKAADGTVKKVGTAAADKQKAVIAQVVTDWAYINDDDVKTVASKTYTNYVTAIRDAAKAAADAATTYKAADVAAAEAVTAQLKAAKTGAEAEAALKAYAALTDAQKELVSSADVAAAEAVAVKAAEAEAAAQLVKEQDLAAVKYVNNPKTKTVKLATAKKGTATITYKSKVSASGNTVTYAKVSGAKIKVAKTGKVTLKKVTKAGTYTGKVKVTCGDATRTVKVKFIVK